MLVYLDISDTFNMTNLAPYYVGDSYMTLQPGEHDIWMSFNNPIDIGLFDFRLTMQMNKVLGYVYYQLMGQLWA